MNSVISHLKKIPLFVRVLVAGSGFAAVLSLALAAPDWAPREPRAVPPPAVSRLRAESRPVAGPLTLTSLAVGPKPWVMAAGRQVVASFVTDGPENCRLTATARVTEGWDPKAIRWTVAAPVGFVVPVDGVWSGPKLDVVLRRPGGNPSGFGGPLVLTVQAQMAAGGQKYTARETLVQDEIDQLRQEYVDLERRTVPERSEFLDAAGFTARYGRRYPWLRFEDLNWSVNPTTRLRYSYAIVQPDLVDGLDRVRRQYGGVTINSGYRNPTRQVEVHAPVRESLHQYGYAADLAVTPGGGRNLPNEADWRRLAEVACGARAKWVEPLASSAPNSPGCHVHLDYRPGSASSAPVGLRGQVVASETGRPVAGALVLLGGMPARTDANGMFAMRNVLSGGEYLTEVRADGYEPLVQPVRLTAWRTVFTRLKVQPPAPAGLTASVAGAEWVDARAGLLEVTVRVTNSGTGTIGDVQLSALPERAELVSQTPTMIGAMQPGAVRGVRMRVRLRDGQDRAALPVAVGLLFRAASGQEGRTQMALLAPLPEMPTKPAVALQEERTPTAARPSLPAGKRAVPSPALTPGRPSPSNSAASVGAIPEPPKPSESEPSAAKEKPIEKPSEAPKPTQPPPPPTSDASPADEAKPAPAPESTPPAPPAAGPEEKKPDPAEPKPEAGDAKAPS